MDTKRKGEEKCLALIVPGDAGYQTLILKREKKATAGRRTSLARSSNRGALWIKALPAELCNFIVNSRPTGV